MKVLALGAASFTLMMTTSALAVGKVEPLDVTQWLKGCAALTDGNIAMSMDIQCFGLAVEYCAMGRSFSDTIACRKDLLGYVETSTMDLIGKLEEVSGQIDDQTDTFSRTRLSRFLSNETVSPCPEMKGHNKDVPLECHMVEAGLKWSEARSIAREQNLLKSEKRE